MKVSIITNMDAVCGNAEYGRGLHNELQKHFEEVERLEDWDLASGDVVLVNWQEGVVLANGERVRALKQRGKKVIVILQSSWNDTQTYPAPWDWSAPEAADAVVAHEEMSSPLFKVRMIPHAVYVVDQLAESHDQSIGTAGFGFSMKRPDMVITAAERTGLSVRMTYPKYQEKGTGVIHTDPERFRLQYRGRCPMEIIGEFLPVPDVVRILSRNLVNIFWFENQNWYDALGQTGSARLGVSAQRPMIISRHRKFRSFGPYLDDFYVADTEEQVVEFVRQIRDDPNPRIPQRMLRDTSWEVVGQKYKELIEEIA